MNLFRLPSNSRRQAVPPAPQRQRFYTQDSSAWEQEHQLALDEFATLRKSCERRAFDGRKFVLVDLLRESLQRRSETCNAQYKHDLHRLVVTTFLRKSLELSHPSLKDLDPFLRVFYILIDLGCPQLVTLFHTRGLNDSKLPITEPALKDEINLSDIEFELEEERSSFYSEFCEAQYAWCPVVFDLDMMVPWRNQIVPFYRKEKIQPYKNNRPPRDDVTLWEVDVPKELIRPDLMKTLDKSLWRTQDVETGNMSDGKPDVQLCHCYRFALKQFSKDRKISFMKESDVFRKLGAQSGMVQYIGRYEGMNDSEPTYNIILEYGDFDLYTAIRSQLPPVSPSEIEGFWRAMWGISTALDQIHRLKHDDIEYDVWHGDIKPENILHVQQRFKLADPGEARIYIAQDEDGHARAPITGGTRTYAAPEKAPYLDGVTDTPDSILQNSDVWSLGCVFSVAATYVVLGAQGILQYDKIRRKAMELEATASIVKDAFHNGNCVLKAVSDWHQYLQSCTRLTDAFTSQVLNMVDDHMLVVPAEERWTAKKVKEHLEGIIINPRVNALPVPPSIENFLQEISLMAEIESEASVSGSGARIDSERAKMSYRALRHESGDQSQSVRFKSEDELLGIKILPTNQRTRNRATIVEKLTKGQRPSGQYYSMEGPSTRSSISSIAESARPRPSIETNLERDVIETEDTNKVEVQEHPITMWQVQAQLEKIGKERNLVNLRKLKHAFQEQPKSVRGLIKDDPLRSYYGPKRPRDIIYLVDNGSTMARHWGEASYLLRILVWRSLGYDDDGMELYFTNPNTTAKVVQTRHQSVNDFVKAMMDAEPAPPGPGGHDTQIDIKLSEIIHDYVSKRASEVKEKPKTVIILTDGVWAGMQDGEMERVIKYYIEKLEGLHRPEGAGISRQQTPNIQGSDHKASELSKIRPITIQFIAFGHDVKGIERMKKLDDNLTGYPDLIDMEPSNGDVYKMFLGSLDPKWDSRANAANNMIPSTPIKSPSQPTQFVWPPEDPKGDRPNMQLLSPVSPNDTWTSRSESRVNTLHSSYGRPGTEDPSQHWGSNAANQYEQSPSMSPSTGPRVANTIHVDNDHLGRSRSTRSSANPKSRSPRPEQHARSQYGPPNAAAESSYEARRHQQNNNKQTR